MNEIKGAKKNVEKIENFQGKKFAVKKGLDFKDFSSPKIGGG